jgi:hypothetical protein
MIQTGGVEPYASGEGRLALEVTLKEGIGLVLELVLWPSREWK